MQQDTYLYAKQMEKWGSVCDLAYKQKKTIKTDYVEKLCIFASEMYSTIYEEEAEKDHFGICLT